MDGEDLDGEEGLAVRDLTAAEGLLVWGMRHWVACVKGRTDPVPRMLEAFAAGGVAGAVRPLEEILLITVDSATRPRDVRCTQCATVGDGEVDLLAAVACAQARRPADCLARLRGWLPPQPARLAQELVADLAGALHHRKLIIPMRREYGAWRSGGNPADLKDAVPASFSVH